MSQKYIKSQNKNRDSQAFGKYFATAVYDSKFIVHNGVGSGVYKRACFGCGASPCLL